MGPRGDDDSQLLSQRGLIAGIRKAVCGETYWLGPATPLIGISTSRLFLYKATGHCFHPIAGDWKDPKMALETIDMTRAREGLRSALEQERPMLVDLRDRVREFEIHELGYRRCYAISPVATDGGENRLTFEPFNLEILRVVDSDGRERFQKILPLSGGPGIFRAAFDRTFPDHVPLLAEFLERLDVRYDELSYLLNPDRTAGDLRSAVQPFRDIVEWAVLLDIAWKPGQTKALVIRDGLLRSLALRKEILPKLGRSFEEAYREKGSLLVGVAKRSKVLNYLSLALALEGTLRKSYPCFCDVPKEIEREAHPVDEICVLLGGDFVEGVGIFPGQAWEVDSSDYDQEILEYLAETAKSSFPTPGYPEPLIRAHEGAVLHGMEMAVLEDMFIEELLRNQPGNDADKTFEHVAIGRGLLKGGWKEYG